MSLYSCRPLFASTDMELAERGSVQSSQNGSKLFAIAGLRELTSAMVSREAVGIIRPKADQRSAGG